MVSGSSPRARSMSASPRRALPPRLTNLANPRPRPAACSSTHAHMAPDCEKKETPPFAGRAAGKPIWISLEVLMSPSESGPSSRMPASTAARVSSRSEKKPRRPWSGGPLASATAARTPRRSRSSNSAASRSRGRQSTASSTPSGSSSAPAKGTSSGIRPPPTPAAGLTAWTPPLYPAASRPASAMQAGEAGEIRSRSPTTATLDGAKSGARRR